MGFLLRERPTRLTMGIWTSPPPRTPTRARPSSSPSPPPYCDARDLDDAEVLESFSYGNAGEDAALVDVLRPLMREDGSLPDDAFDDLSVATSFVAGDGACDYCASCGIDYDAMTPAQRGFHTCVAEMILVTCDGHVNGIR